MDFYSATKKNEILSFTRLMDGTREHHVNEVIQVQKAKSQMFSLICGI
jgi:hypothetical protein